MGYDKLIRYRYDYIFDIGYNMIHKYVYMRCWLPPVICGIGIGYPCSRPHILTFVPS